MICNYYNPDTTEKCISCSVDKDNDAWDILSNLDENQDGEADYNEEEVSQIIWDHFEFPDYIWVQGNVGFPEEFTNVPSKYSLISTTRTNREVLYEYFGMLSGLYYESIQ